MKRPKFETQAASRVIKFRKERNARGPLWPIPFEGVKAGLDLVQDGEGRIYLTRTSRDGFVQGWRLAGQYGDLRVDKAHRPNGVRHESIWI